MQSKKRAILIYGVIFVILMGLMYAMVYLTNAKRDSVTYKYSDLVYMFQDGCVKEYQLNVSTGRLLVTLNDPIAKEKGIQENTLPDAQGNRRVEGTVKTLDRKSVV